MEEEKKNQTKKLTAFQITAIVLIALLIVAIVVQIIVLVVLKNRTDTLKEKNDEVTIEHVIETNSETDPLLNNFVLPENFDSLQ